MTDGQARGHWRAADFVVAGLLALLVAAGAWRGATSLHPVIYQYSAAGLRTSDMWFDADIPRAACLATDRLALQHQVTALHPLISSVMYLPARALAISAPSSVAMLRRLGALFAAAWIVTCFMLLRLVTGNTLDASLFSVLAAVSATSFFWTTVPEIHLLGSITLMLPICLVAWQAGRARHSETWLTIVSVAALSLTVTNWISGLAAAWVQCGRRRAIQISVNAFVAVSLLWCVQAAWFPHDRYFIGDPGSFSAAAPISAEDAGRVLAAMMFHPIVMPAVATTTEPESAPAVSVQHASIGSSGGWGITATLFWGLLLAGGSLQVWRSHRHQVTPRLLVIVIASQVVLHLIVGDETFLYAMQIAPLLLAVAAIEVRGPHRLVVRTVVSALIVVAAVNNCGQFARAAAVVDANGQELASRGALFQPADACR